MKSISHYDSHSFGKGNAKDNFKKKKKTTKKEPKGQLLYVFFEEKINKRPNLSVSKGAQRKNKIEIK